MAGNVLLRRFCHSIRLSWRSCLCRSISSAHILPCYPIELCWICHFPVEKVVHERSVTRPQPPSIPTSHGIYGSTVAVLLLELAENKYSYRYPRNRIGSGHSHSDKTMLCHWADQAVEALEFAHSLGAYNSDIHCLDFLLHDQPNLQVADWAVASTDGSPPRSVYLPPWI
jgi:hypothetical protein